MKKLMLMLLAFMPLFAAYTGVVPCNIVYTQNGVTLMNEIGNTRAECTRLQDKKAYLISANNAAVNGGCGLESNDLSQLNYKNNVLKDGLQTLNLDAFRFDNFNDISGFKCPKYSTLPAAKKGIKTEATITNIDFYTGDYTCVYNFLNSKSFYKLRLNNKSCKSALKASTNQIQNINSMANINFTDYGIYNNDDLSAYKSNEKYSIFNFSQNIKDVYDELQSGIDSLKSERNKKKTFIDIKNDLDSHKHFQYTLPSLITGIITTDPDFFQNRVIGENGDLQIRPTPAIFSKDTGVASFVDTIDRKLWGFYYYLMKNMGTAFGNIITLIFGLGTIGVFGFAYIKKTALMHKQNSGMEDFNFLTKFLGVFATFTFFAAPIIPTHSTIPDQFIYHNNGDVAVSKDVSHNSTLIKTFLRFVFQKGTFWANEVNDYGYYSYLKYIENNYGNFKTDNLTKNYKDNVSVLLQKQVLLKEKVNFFEQTCGFNYYSVLENNQDLPNYYGGQTNGINFLKDNPLGFTKVDYNFCSTLYSQIQQQTKDNLLDYRFTLDRYDQIANKIDDINHYDLENMNNFLTEAVGYNNKLGWMSVALVPSLTQIFEIKDILKYADSYNSKANDKLVGTIGTMDQKQKNLIRDKQNELFKGNSKKSWWTSIWETTKEKAKDAGQFTQNMFSRGMNYLSIGNGNVLGWTAAKAMYSIFPGFSEVKDSVKNSGIAAIFANGVSTITSKIPGIGVVTKLASFVGSSKDAGGILVYLINYTLSILLYGFLISTLALMLITALIIIKIIYYFVEMIVAVFVSLAVMLWSLVFDKNQAYSSVGEFFYKVVLLAFTPITIVLSVYVYIFSKATLYWLYSMLMEAVYHISTTSGTDVKGHSLTGAFTQVQIYAIYNLGDIILSFLSIFLAYSIIFSFNSWMMDYFGHKGQNGLKKGFDHVADEFKQKALSKA